MGEHVTKPGSGLEGRNSPLEGPFKYNRGDTAPHALQSRQGFVLGWQDKYPTILQGYYLVRTIWFVEDPSHPEKQKMFKYREALDMDGHPFPQDEPRVYVPSKSKLHELLGEMGGYDYKTLHRDTQAHQNFIQMMHGLGPASQPNEEGAPVISDLLSLCSPRDIHSLLDGLV